MTLSSGSGVKTASPLLPCALAAIQVPLFSAPAMVQACPREALFMVCLRSTGVEGFVKCSCVQQWCLERPLYHKGTNLKDLLLGGEA